MSWRLTPEERRIIERTQRSDDGHGDSLQDGGLSTQEQKTETPAGEGRGSLWRSVLAWIGGICFLVLLALFMVWVGSLL